MKAAGPAGRMRQKLRTRAALVSAALSLLRQARTPTISEVAEAALVSPATAYRYFPNSRALWLAVLSASGEPDKAEVFARMQHAGALARVETLIRVAGFRMFDDELLWRTASRAVHTGSASENGAQRIPVPTGLRMRWIREALAPCEKELGRAGHRRLSMALALVLGSETITTLRDVCGLDVEEAKDLSLWAGQALTRAVLAERPKAHAARRPQRRTPRAHARSH